MEISKKILSKTKLCFVSETRQSEVPLKDPSVRYRCYNFCEELSGLSAECCVVSAANFFKNPRFDFDVYIFHRPTASREGFHSVMRHLKRGRATIIADYDDLIFGDAEVSLSSSAVKNGTLSEEQAEKTFKKNLEALLEFDVVTVSTNQLAYMVRMNNKHAKVITVNNFIPTSLLGLHSRQKTHLKKRYKKNIGYFAGTKSHDKDFPIVAPALHRVLCEEPDVSFTLFGPVSIPASLKSLSNVTHSHVVPYSMLPSAMSLCSTVIAPLEESIFNSCKSRVKFLEANISGCRLITSPIPDMLEVGVGTVDFCSNLDDWYYTLKSSLGEELSNNERENRLSFLIDKKNEFKSTYLEEIF